MCVAPRGSEESLWEALFCKRVLYCSVHLSCMDPLLVEKYCVEDCTTAYRSVFVLNTHTVVMPFWYTTVRHSKGYQGHLGCVNALPKEFWTSATVSASAFPVGTVLYCSVRLRHPYSGKQLFGTCQ